MNTEQKLAAVDMAKKNFIQIRELFNENEDEKWEYVTEVDACSMWRRIEDASIQCVRTACQMDFPHHFVFQFIWDLSTRKSFDEYIKELIVAEKFEPELVTEPVKEIDILYASFGMPFPISGRDFVHIRAYTYDEERKEYLTTARSIDHPNHPENSSFVRGSLEIDGFCIGPLPNDPSKSIVRYIAKVDPKGSIPAFAVNLANRKVPQTLSGIRKAIAVRWNAQNPSN